jgi:hypothetical protein
VNERELYEQLGRLLGLHFMKCKIQIAGLQLKDLPSLASISEQQHKDSTQNPMSTAEKEKGKEGEFENN